MMNIRMEAGLRLREQLKAARRAHRSFEKAAGKAVTAFDNWAFDHGMLLLELTIGKGFRKANAIVAIYDDHSEKTIAVEL